MTALESPLTRITTLIVDGRPVDVTLIPANQAALEPEAIEFHLKGTQQYKRIPLAAILKAVGWKVQLPKAPSQRPDQNLDQLIADLTVALKPWKEAQS